MQTQRRTAGVSTGRPRPRQATNSSRLGSKRPSRCPEKGRVAESNFDNYQMLRINSMPEVETYLALSGGDKWGGIGEPSVPTIAPAVCNAIFKITGKRIRSLPLSNHDLSWT